jgi:hypothetical protein
MFERFIGRAVDLIGEAEKGRLSSTPPVHDLLSDITVQEFESALPEVYVIATQRSGIWLLTPVTETFLPSSPLGRSDECSPSIPSTTRALSFQETATTRSNTTPVVS